VRGNLVFADMQAVAPLTSTEEIKRSVRLLILMVSIHIDYFLYLILRTKEDAALVVNVLED
jgi:hypothetical protein